MYKELATIKTEKEVTGFIVYDGTKTSVMTIDQMKKEAANGNIDSLSYKNGEFIPILKGDIVKEMKRVFVSKRYKKLLKTMSYEDFVDTDCIFQQKDIELVNHNLFKGNLVLACIGSMFISDGLRLTIAFYSPNSCAITHVKEQLHSYGRRYKVAKDFDNFIMLNLPLYDDKTGFNFHMFQIKMGIRILFNLDSLETMNKRMDNLISCYPKFLRNRINTMRPTSEDIYNLADMLLCNNAATISTLSKRME